jgi:hypothetical protein
VKGKNQLRRREKKTSSNKKMGYRKNKFMAQQIQKTTVRYEKKAENYLGLVHLSCCITVYRRIILG